MIVLVLGLVVVVGVIVLEVSVSMHARAEAREARNVARDALYEAEDWRTVAENLGSIVAALPVGDSLAESRLARASAQLHACREAYPR